MSKFGGDKIKVDLAGASGKDTALAPMFVFTLRFRVEDPLAALELSLVLPEPPVCVRRCRCR